MSRDFDEYLQSLRTRVQRLRDELSTAEIALGHAEDFAQETPSPRKPEARVVADKQSGAPFEGMSPREASEEYLRWRGTPASTVDIREALLAGQVDTKAKKFHQSLYTTLGRMQEQETVVNYGMGVWGLPEWPHPTQEELELISAAQG